MRKLTHVFMIVALLAALLIPDNRAYAASEAYLGKAVSYGSAKHGSDSGPYIKKEYTSILTGASGTLTVYKVPENSEISYQSSDESVLTVQKGENNTCEYTGVAPGTATITVKITEPVFLFISNTSTLKFTVDVTPKAVSIKFNKGKYQLEVGESKKLKYTLRPSITDEIPVFESEDPEIVTVNAKGKITAKAKGTTYVTAYISNGCSDKCKIIVK